MFSFLFLLVTALLPLPLKLYQEEGVKWMLSREKVHAVNGVQGGILGDDMGKLYPHHYPHLCSSLKLDKS